MARAAATLTPLRQVAPAPRDRVLDARADQSCVVQVVDRGDLAAHRPAWETLAQDALEPNCFYEPWMLLPALTHFAGKSPIELVLVHGPANQGVRPMWGLFPCERKTRLHGVPVRQLTLWKHLHCFLCTPLVHRDHAHAALTAFVQWAATDRAGVTLLDMPFIAGDGPFAQALVDVVRDRSLLTFQVDCFNRALLGTGASSESYIHAALTPRHRRELERMRRRLAELGSLQARILTDVEDPTPWIEHFLALEAGGWKGAEQTALGCCARERDYFREIAQAAHARRRLMMLGLFLDEKPIALKCNFRAGQGGFAFKIAFDERFNKYSPGVQLELDTIAEVHRDGCLRWVDSCADPRHPMINRLWTERRTVQHIVLSPGGVWGNLLVGLLPLLRSLKRTVLRRSRSINETT